MSASAEKHSKTVIFFLGMWVILNLLQAFFTELAHDEAYYWLYGKYLDWMYFDHPPVTGLLIKMGYFLIPNELGVRLFIVLSTTITLYMIWHLAQKPDPKLYFAVIFGTFLAHVGGFLAAPDVPLLFVATLYFWFLKKYLEADTWKTALPLCLIVPLIIYTKYHGILLVVFTIASNVALLKRKSFWLIAVSAITLLLPQIFWQFAHNFPTVEYYFVSRPKGAYKITDTLNFVLGVLVISGPLMGFLTIYAASKQKAVTDFQRALRFNMIGIFCFFLLFTFRGKVEANWIAQCFIPLFILSVPYLEKHATLKKWVYYLSIPSIVLILVARIHLSVGLVEFKGDRTSEYRGWKEHTEKVVAFAAGRPILANTYQHASKLSFYAGQDIASLNVGGRRNQFSIWKWENDLIGKEIVWCGGMPQKNATIVEGPGKGKTYLTVIPNFVPLNQVTMRPESSKLIYSAKEIVEVPVLIEGLVNSDGVLQSNEHTTLRFIIYNADGSAVEYWGKQKTKPLPELWALKKQAIKVKMPDTPGEYRIQFSFQTESMTWWNNMEPIPLTIQSNEKQ